MCLKMKLEGLSKCIFSGNLPKDHSYFAVTATNLGQCRPFSNDPLEVIINDYQFYIIAKNNFNISFSYCFLS